MFSQKLQRLVKLKKFKRKLQIEKRILYLLKMQKIWESEMMFNQREIYQDMSDGQDIFCYTDKRKYYYKESKSQLQLTNSAKHWIKIKVLYWS